LNADDVQPTTQEKSVIGLVGGPGRDDAVRPDVGTEPIIEVLVEKVPDTGDIGVGDRLD